MFIRGYKLKTIMQRDKVVQTTTKSKLKREGISEREVE